MEGEGGLSEELLSKARSRGSRWLVDQADRGQLVGELRPLRRLAWIKLLGVVSGESIEAWAEELDTHRKLYAELVEEYRKETDVKAVDPKLCNPLSRNADNPYLKIQVNEELLKEIWKDVERTFPECQFLSSPESRKVLQRILFHWCRSKNPSMTPSESYRQGMNELAAVLYAAMKQGEFSNGMDREALGPRLCGSRYNEADAFACFVQLMERGLRPMFLVTSSSRPAKSPIGDLPRSRIAGGDQGPPGSAILVRCQFIFETVVRAADEELFNHLRRLDIEPQVFLLRWIRLLFCREFPLQETFILWDGLLHSATQAIPAEALRYPGAGPGASAQAAAAAAEASEASAQLPLADFAAAALLLRMRRDLLRLDQTECLRRLLRSNGEDSAQELLKEAKSLLHTGPPRSTGVGRDFLGEASPSKQMAAPSARPVAPLGPEVQAEDPLRRGQQFISAAAQSAQGLLQAGRQAYAKLASEQAQQSVPQADPKGAPGAARPSGASLTQSIANWVDIDLWSEKHGGTAGQEDAGLRRRAERAEQERDDLKRKAQEFVAKKKAEFAAQLAERDQKILELEEQLAEARQREAELQRRLAEAHSASPGAPTPAMPTPEAPAASLPLAEEEEESKSEPPPAPARELQVPSDMASEI